MKDLKYELGGHFEEIVVALMMPAADYDATSLRKAIKVFGAFSVYVNWLISIIRILTFVWISLP